MQGSDGPHLPFLHPVVISKHLHSASQTPNPQTTKPITSKPIRMFSLRTSTARLARSSLCANCARLPLTTTTSRSLSSKPQLKPTPLPRPLPSTFTLGINQPPRPYSTKSSADEIIEEITDQYATARDEFEIATEETEKKSVYGADDRVAAREELDKLKGMYDAALAGPNGEEIKSRIGQRIRELDNAVVNLEKSALED